MSKKRACILAAILLFALLPFNRSAGVNLPANNPQSVNYTQLDLGYSHTCAITDSGASVCWGINDEYYRQLGTTTPEEFFPFPIRPLGLTNNALKVSTGYDHGCVINSLGETWCWGSGSYGQSGDGEVDHDGFPVQVVNFANPSLISAGGNTTCGANTAGQAYCWGVGTYGQMGNGTNLDVNPSPVAVTIEPVSKISVGGAYRVCAINTGGAAFCWGADTWGQLGNGAPLANSNLPVPVTGLGAGTMADIAGGGLFTCGLTVGGGVKCWGYNGDGELGNNSTTDSPVPVNVSGLSSGVSAIAAGDYHACALMVADGSVKCWGYNGYGQIGDGTDTNRLVPVAVVGLSAPAVAISGGGNHTCAVLNNGSMQCWGYNSEGQLGVGDDDPDIALTPVTVIDEMGSVMGTVTYAGTQPNWHTIYVTLHENMVDPPFESYWIYNNDLYGFGGLPDRDFYIGAFMDVDDDGGGPPDPWEPSGWYDGPDAGSEPDLVSIAAGANLYELDFELFDPVVSFSIFLPLTLR
jgi:alpha-tubulin suppressor-like RCC1 family protein